jgi:biopolymer transport protein ExbB/TolQ
MLIERLTKLALLGSSWVLYVLLFLSVISIATMVERWAYFARRAGDLERQRPKLVDHLERVDLEGLEKLLAVDRTLQGRITREAIRWLSGGTEAMADAVDAELARIRTELERGTNFLGTLGNNAPFLGLFGTVLGVIIAFHSLGAAGGNTSSMGGVMSGIAEALVATGVGLFVALPAVVGYNIIQRKIGQIEGDAAALVKLVSAYAKSNPSLIEHARLLSSAPAVSAEGARRRPSITIVKDDSPPPSVDSGTQVVVPGEAQG